MEKPLECEINPEFKPNFKNQNYVQYHTSKNFIKLVSDHSPRWLGHTFFKTSKNALEVINNIDPSHLPAGLQINENLTPASFGAEITGVIGSVQKFFEKFKHKNKLDEFVSENNEQSDEINLNDFNPFTQREQNYFNRKPSNLHEKAYKFVTAHAGSLAKAAKGAAIIGTLALVTTLTLPSLAQTHDFNTATKAAQAQINQYVAPMSVRELNNVISDFESQSYTEIDDFKEDANYALDAIQQTCQTYLKQYQLPSQEEVKSILNNLDNVTSTLIEKPVELAYQNNYPDHSNFKADLYYNDTVTDYKNLNKRKTVEGIKITATDPNGNPISTEVPKISSPLGATDLFERVLNSERGYDQKFDQFFDAISNPDAINPDTGTNYTYSEIRDLYNNFFSTIINECETVRTLLVPNIEIQQDGTFKFVLPEQEQEQETQTSNGQTKVINENGETYIIEDDDREQ